MANAVPLELAAQVNKIIDKQQKSLIDFTQQLISIPSINPPGDEQAVVQCLRSKIRELGLGRAKIYALKKQRPNLICHINGADKGPTLILNGHTDTVPITEPEKWANDPHQSVVINGRLHGLGSTDMKAGLGAMIFAGLALSQMKAHWRGAVLLAFSADEEYGSRYGVEYLMREQLLTGDAAVICEPCGIQQDFDSLHVACRGISRFRFHIFGQSRHSGFSYLPGTVNASTEMAWVLRAAQEHLQFEYEPNELYPQGPSINIGLRVESGLGYAIVPDRAVVYNEVRTLPGMNKKNIEKGLNAFLAFCRENRPGLKMEFAFEAPPHDWLPSIEISPDEPIVHSALRAAKTVLLQPPTITGYSATTDARLFATYADIPAIAAFGPGLITLAHAPNECATITSIVKAAKIYALMALDYLR